MVTGVPAVVNTSFNDNEPIVLRPEEAINCFLRTRMDTLVLGGFLIGLIQGFNDGLPFAPGQKWSQTMVFTILILLMVYRPAGLLGKATTEKV